MQQHTPGPWEIKRETQNEPTMPFGQFRDVRKLIIGSGEGTLDDPFHVVHSTIDNGEITADTHLIAAAPELLEALEECQRINRNDHSLDARRRMADIFQAAISKATGESKR